MNQVLMPFCHELALRSSFFDHSFDLSCIRIKFNPIMKRIQSLTKYIPSKVTKFVCCNVALALVINVILLVKFKFEHFLLGDHETGATESKRKAILLMAGYRGGSTLTGELFNRNEDILYYFGKVLT